MPQVPPFQCIVSVWLKSARLPTAQMSFGDEAARACRRLFVPATLGLDTMLHDVPFQCSIRVEVCVPLWQLPVQVIPTAHTSFVAMAVTAERELSALRLGLDTRLQTIPSQCSVRVLPAPALP